MSLTPGTRFGGYEVLEWLGAGGMGEVYRARDSRLGRDIALKTLRSELSADPDRRTRIEREARILASLNHPNIAQIYGIEETGEGARAIAMELVEGQTLAEIIEGSRLTAQGSRPAQALSPKPQALSLTAALHIARQVAEALEAAHAQGVVHRDLKPANIKVRPDGTVKVLDFGLARAVEDLQRITDLPTVTVTATAEGQIAGTPAYMSPEQAAGQTVDRRSDIWAFGCVLFEMITGERAFGAPTVPATLARVLGTDPEWSSLPQDIAPAIRRLLERCVTKDLRRRLHDIGDARVEIEDAIANAGAPTALQPVQPVNVRARIGWITGGVAIAALVGLGAAWWFASRQPAAASPSISLSLLPARGTVFPSTGPWPVVSPDGQHVVYAAAEVGGEQRLWLRALDRADARPLTGTEGAIRPFWSPDSRSIGFFANGKLSRVEIDTGALRVLADVPYAGALAGAWGDNAIVFRQAGGLFRLSPAGGERTMLIPSSDDLIALAPNFLPGGRRFVFVAERGGGKEHQVCVGSLDVGATSCLNGFDSPVVYAAPGYLLTVKDGALVAQRFDADSLTTTGEVLRIPNAQVTFGARFEPPLFSASENGVLAFHPGTGLSQLTWHDRGGARQGKAVGAGMRPALSPNERLLVVQRSDSGNADLWVYDLDTGSESRLTFDRRDDTWPTFSPDGQTVIFASERNGPAQLFRKRISGEASEEPLVPDVRGINPHASADGQIVLFQKLGVGNTFDILAVRPNSADPPVPVAETEHGEREGRFSPDGRWVAYDSTETGRREVWIRSFPPTGARWQISRTGGVSPRWRADGRELFYVAGDGRMMAVSIESGTAIRTGAAVPLFPTIFSGGVYASYVVSRDGQRFLLPVPPPLEDAAPITVVVNWTALLGE